MILFLVRRLSQHSIRLFAVPQKGLFGIGRAPCLVCKGFQWLAFGSRIGRAKISARPKEAA